VLVLGSVKGGLLGGGDDSGFVRCVLWLQGFWVGLSRD